MELFIIAEIFLIFFFRSRNKSLLLVSIIFWFYVRAPFLDYFILNSPIEFNFNYNYRFTESIYEWIYLISTSIAFLLSLYLFKPESHLENNNLAYKKFPIILLIIFCLLSLYDASIYWGQTREEIGASSNLITLLHRNVRFYSIPLLFCLPKKNKLVITTLIISIISFVISKEREPLAMIFIIFWVIYIYKFSSIKQLFFFAISSIIILVWKLFYIWFEIQSFSLQDSIQEKTFTFSSLDAMLPFVTSIAIMRGEWEQTFPYPSYILGPIEQFIRVFTEFNFESMSEVNTRFMTNDNYGAAFTAIGESWLNFHFFGPVVLIIFSYLFYKLLTKIIYSTNAAHIIFIMIFLKFMRTELAILMKLQIIPILILLIILNSYAKYRNTNIQ